MNKKEFVKKLAEVNNMTQKDAEIVINAFVRGVVEATKEGEDVTISNFGKFYIQHREGGRKVNPNYGESPIVLSDKNFLRFKASQTLIDNINK